MATSNDDDFDTKFAAIVSPMASTMDWDLGPDPDVLADEIAQERAAVAEREDRERRQREAQRELRRRERARELAEYESERAALEAEYNSEDDHFTPPDPPPLPRWRRVTVAGVLLVLLGIGLIAMPELLRLNPQFTMVLGVLAVVGGGCVLASRLRSRDDGDTGAVL